MTLEEKPEWYEGLTNHELMAAVIDLEKENVELKRQLRDLKKYMKDNNLGAYGDDLK